MKRRALWLGGFFVFVIVAVIIVVGMFNKPMNEDGRIMDISAETVLKPAFEVYSWFISAPLEHDDVLYSEDYPYYRVTDQRVENKEELENIVKEYFSDDIAARLLDNGVYIDIDGKLYVNSAFDLRAEAINKAEEISKEVFTIVTKDAQKVIYQADVSYSDDELSFDTDDVSTYHFVYENLGERWAFTYFDYYK